jgi:DNA-binding GntR family transcriptional regulator
MHPRQISDTEFAGDWPQSTGRMVDRVIDYIVARVHSGEYAQGRQLVARNIAKQLNVNVAPVREALHRLSGEGVVELFSNRSARVRHLSPADIFHALEVWEVHAGLMARLAAQRIKIRDNAERVRAVTEDVLTAQKQPDPGRYFTAIIRYQAILAEISENPYVDAVRKRLHTEFWTPQILSFIPKPQWPEYVASFGRIHAAILSGNPDEAEQQYKRHVRWAASVLRTTLPRDVAGLKVTVESRARPTAPARRRRSSSRKRR